MLGAANGSNTNCAAATFSALTTTASTSYRDVGRSAPQGSYFCYKVQTTFASWASQQANPTAAAQLGFVVTAIQMVNDGNHTGCAAGTFGAAGIMDCGDQFVVTFNQPVNTDSGRTPSPTTSALTRSPRSSSWPAPAPVRAGRLKP